MTAKPVLAALLLAAGTAVIGAPPATADDSGCIGQATWDATGRSIMRTLCDGPLQPDGSWQRCRTLTAAAYFMRGSKGASLQGTWVPPLNSTSCDQMAGLWAPGDEPGWWAPPAAGGPAADPDALGCISDAWWDAGTGRRLTRTLCDGPLQPDGSWQRCRSLYGPARWISGQDNQGNWPPGFWVPEINTSKCDPVLPGAVLPSNEPWWIPS